MQRGGVDAQHGKIYIYIYIILIYRHFRDRSVLQGSGLQPGPACQSSCFQARRHDCGPQTWERTASKMPSKEATSRFAV